MADKFGDEVRGMFSWREKRSGVIAPDERLPWPNTIALGMQLVLRFDWDAGQVLIGWRTWDA